MDLPPELRVQVYAELVVVGRVYYTPSRIERKGSHRFDGYRPWHRPSLSILRVSKSVHDESEEVYLGRNIFVLPLTWLTLQPFTNTTHRPSSTDRRLFSSAALTKLKHLSIALDPQVNAPLSMAHLVDEGYYIYNQMTATEIHVRTHDNAHYTLSYYFDVITANVAYFGNLESFEVDFNKAYCPLFSRCRLFHLAWKQVTSHAKKIRILGLRDESEKTELLNVWSGDVGMTVAEIKHQYQVEFVMKSS
jgi:hypothetical protein